MQNNQHKIEKVYPDSIAEEMGIEPGDILLEINGQPLEDVFDYRYLIKDEYIEVLIRKPTQEEWLLEIDKEYEDDLGIEFENGLMSDYRSCSNQCIFCFIDQMPPGMRETLYFKDDDSRLSFLQGNYITLTNMKEKDIERIIRLHLSPINISVQTTNPELRCKMLNNRFAGEKLKFLQTLYEGHVEMNGQIVCCKGVNDGTELKRTIQDLRQYLPFMRSVSVVPAGVTRFRQGLYPLESFGKEEAETVIDMIEEVQMDCYQEYGLHFIHASDEWYILAERPFPGEERYDGYIQLENGVGMMRLLIDEFEEAKEKLKKNKKYKEIKAEFNRTVTLATGKLTYSTICHMAEQLMELLPGLKATTIGIRNDFFGESITVSGLITGQDLIAQTKELQKQGKNLGDTLLIPSNMLRTGEQVFLDDLTVQDVEQALNMKVVALDTGGEDFVQGVLDPEYDMNRDNGNFVYQEAYPK